jgi:hypothetical protein
LPGLLGATACTIWALVDSRFRDAEGFPTGEIVVPFALALGVLALGWAGTGRWAAAARWFALAAIGQAVALQMIDAGPLIHYQHYRLDSSSSTVWIVVLLVQTALVVAGGRGHVRTLGAWRTRRWAGWRLAGVALAALACAAALSRDPLTYGLEIWFAVFVEAVNAANLLLMAAAIPSEALPSLQQQIDRWIGAKTTAWSAEPGRIDRFALGAGVWMTGLTAVLAAFIYERHPHVPDEVIYLYPAYYFAHGMLGMPVPPVPASFELYLLDVFNGRWFSPVQPGWPAILAVGALLNVPWLVNPILAGLNVVLAYVLVYDLYDRRTARLTTLLLCCSPWFIFTGMSFMTHMATLACALAPAVLLVRARRRDNVWLAVLAGVLVGFGAIIRQLDGLMVACLLGLWLLGCVATDAQRLRHWQQHLGFIAAFGIATGVVSAFWIPINLYFTGSPTSFPLENYLDRTFWPGENSLGFGPNRGMGWALQPLPGHSPLNALLNTLLNLFSVNVELLGWATGSVVLIAAMVFSGRLGKREWLGLGVIAIVVGTYGLYWYSGGPDFAARYWFLALLPLLILVVRALQELEDAFGARVLATTAALSVLVLTIYIPWRAFDKYHHYLNMRPDIPELADHYAFGRSLVMIRGPEHPDYASAIIYNPLDLQADAPVYVHVRGTAADAQIIQAYADRPIWIIDGPTLTHGAYQVAAGPLTAADLLGPDAQLLSS